MSEASSAARADAPLLGIGLMVGALALFVLADAAAKSLFAEHHFVQVVWARVTFQALAIAVFVLPRGAGRALRTTRPWLHVLRGVLLLVMVSFFYLSLSFIPMADAAAVAMSAPLFVTALSAMILAERIGPRRWAAVAAGLLGALVVIRPGLGVVHWAAAMPLVAAVCFAGLALLTRALTRTEDQRAIMFYTAVTAAVLCSVAVPFFWSPPSVGEWLLIVAMGALAATGDVMLIAALRRAQASLLAPFLYVQLIWAAIVGYLVFDDIPDRWTLLGALIIVVVGLYVMHRERAVKRARRRIDGPGEVPLA